MALGYLLNTIDITRDSSKRISHNFKTQLDLTNLCLEN